MEWDDDCRVGTGEQLELEVEGGVAGVPVGASAEKDVVEGGEEEEEVQELRVAWPLDP